MNLAILKLVNAYFWKTYYGPIFSMFFPVLMLAILGNILRVEYVYPGIIAMSTMFIGILSMPLMLSEIKQSSLFKYIGTTSVTPLKLILNTVSYFLVVALLSTLIIFCVTTALFYKKVFPAAKDNGIFSGLKTTTGALSFIFSWFLHFIFSIAIGVLMFSIISTGQHMAVIAFVIAIPSMFLSGMILSVDIISQSEVMQWLSRFDPFRYTTGNLVISATPKAQIGDLFQSLTSTDLKMIFKFGGAQIAIEPNGPKDFYFNHDNNSNQVLVQSFVNGQKVTHLAIYDVNSLTAFINSIPQESKTEVLADKTLYSLLFETKAPIVGSSNNVFSFKKWGVRRIPDVNVIRNFVMNYFLDGQPTIDANGNPVYGGKKDRFDIIWGQIQRGNFGWLDVFLKQNTTLYYTGDRVANIFAPLILSGLLFFGAKYKFHWK